MAEPMVELFREGYLESVHLGDIAAVGQDGRIIAKLGDPGMRTFWRSAAKPIQALIPFMSGAVEEYGISDEEYAVVCASHFGEEIHTRAVLSMLGKIGLTEADLSCGVHYPFSKRAANALVSAGIKPTQLHHNCSGKHTGMLMTCRKMGWSTEGYFRPDHPLQKATLDAISEISEVAKDEIGIGVDGCSVPVFYLPLRAMALCYAKLASPDRLPSKYREAARKVVEVMTAYPEMVGGQGGSFTTELMKAYKGRVFAKNGAEGVFCFGVPETGLGLALKIQDGAERAYQSAVIGCLDQLGIRQDEGSTLYAVRDVKNSKGDTVGDMRPAFKLDFAKEARG